jgi:hypothetical protein
MGRIGCCLYGKLLTFAKPRHLEALRKERSMACKAFAELA